MKHRAVLASLGFVCLLLLSWQSSLCPQEKKPGNDKPNPIEGDWSKVVSDRGIGAIWFMLPQPHLMPRKRGGWETDRTLRWKITKESIEEGWEGANRRFPQKRYTYKLNPGNQANAIDFSLVEKDLNIADKTKRRKPSAWDKETQRGIYIVIDDYLIICIGEKSRPKGFTTDEKDNLTLIDIFRRGKLYKEDDKESSNPKPKDSSKSKGKGK